MKPVPVPRIVVYVGDGAIDWHEVAIPDNLEVIDQRVEAAPVQPIQGGVIRGSVFDMATGRPIADTRVGIWALDPDTESHYETEAVAVADKLGAYLIQSVLTPGSYEIRFAAFGYATRSESYILGDETQYNEYEVELMRTSHIGGIVVDAEGIPVPGVRVEAREVLAIDGHSYYRKTGRFTQKPGAQTDDQGRFTIEDIPAGYARLRARAPDLFSYGSLVLHEVPSDDVRIVVVGTGIIRGRVVGGAEAARIGQLHIHLIALDPDNKWGGAARCKEDGAFEFKGVPPGRYRLSTVPDDLPGVAQNPNARIVEVKPGATVEVAVLHHLATPTPTPPPPIS
ncbi:carboxypeptidase regulatory-like domain-containing protein [Candidatus Sumerlaeota bacterium]|nr:carboxypeptidase regulatory-like domain-containing protein [Candidatus Sumerlaeota bacterium]